MRFYRSLRELDWPLLIVTLVPLCGWACYRSIVRRSHKVGRGLVEATDLGRHGFVDDVGHPSMIDYHALLGRVTYFYMVRVVLLIVTMALGNKVFGSTRWIERAGITAADVGVR